jgi:predicted secreted protein
MILNSIFIWSVVLIVLFLGVRSFEEKRSFRLGARIRARADLVVIAGVARLEQFIRNAVSVLSRKVVIAALRQTALSLVLGLQRLEEWLISLIAVFRGKNHGVPRSHENVPKSQRSQ